MKTIKRLSVISFLIITLVTFTSILSGLMGWIIYKTEKKQERAKLGTKYNYIIELLSASLSLPLEELNENELEKIFISSMNDQDIEGIVLKSITAKNNIFIRIKGYSNTALSDESKLRANNFFVKKKNIVSNKKIIGTVEVFYHTNNLQIELRNLLFYISLTILSFNLALVLILYFFLRYSIIKPLNKVENYVLSIISGKQADKQPDNKGYLKEIESLNSSIANMYLILGSRYEELKGSEIRYRSLFKNTLAPAWEEDFSEVYVLMQELKKLNLPDISKYLINNQDIVINCASMVKITDANKAAQKMHQVATNDIIIPNLERNSSPISFGNFIKELTAIYNSEINLEFDCELISKDGKVKNVTLFWSVVEGFEKNYARVLVSLNDNTERQSAECNLEDKTNELEITNKLLHEEIEARKKAEEALKTSYNALAWTSYEFEMNEKKYREIFENIPVGIFQTSIEGKWMTANPFLARILGCMSVKELITTVKNVETQLYVKQNERKEFIKKLKESGKPESIEVQILRVDGVTIWVQIKAYLDEQNNALNGYVIDINERKNAEAELLRSKARLLRGELVSKAGNWELRLKTKTLLASDGAKKIYGLQGDHWDLLEIGQIPLPKYQPLVNKALYNLINKNEPYNIEFKIRKPGTGEVVDIHSIAEYDVENEIIFGVIQDITDRKVIEEELQRSKSLYQDLVETGQDLIWQCDLEGRYTFLNHAWEDVFGYKLEEMTGKKFIDFQTKEWAEKVSKEFKRLLQGNTIKGLETVHIGKDGREISLIFNAKYIVDENNNIIGTRGTAYDITGRKQMERSLKESNERLQSIVNVAPFGAHTYELQTYDRLIFIGANKSADLILGVDHTQFIGKTIEEAFPGLVSTEIPRIYRKVASTGETFKDEQVTYDGENIHGAFEIHAVQTGTNKMTVFFKDISERKKAEEVKQRYNNNLSSLLEISQALTSTLELETILQIIVQKAVDIFNLDSGAIYLVTNEDLYLGATVPPIPNDVPEGVRYALLSNHPHIKLSLVLGEPLAIADTSVAILSEEEQKLRDFRGLRSILYLPLIIGQHAVGVLIVSAIKEIRTFSSSEIDIYRTLSSQAALVIDNARLFKQTKNHAKELEQRVQERTAELEVSNKELEAFSYSVSHDLRAPLRGIEGWSTALIEDYGAELDNKAHQYLNRIRNDVDRMGILIDNLLQLSRVTRSEIKYEPLNLSKIAHSILDRMKEEFTERNIEFDIHPDLTGYGDLHLIEIALTNLLNNACKFTSKNLKAVIEFGQKITNEKPTYFIKDNGVGFDMRYSQKLFAPFQRMHKSSEFPGTGIGLATVQRIIHRHGGRIWVESAVEQGTTFYFTLKDQ